MLAISIVSLFGIGIWHINLFLTFLIAIILAHFSYFYFEKFFLKLK
jgi:peptidoglycan/LPS O-acetylase OafA/YrhL